VKRFVGAVALLLALASPSRARADDPPDARGGAGLRADVARIVDAESAGGWFLDATHLEAMKPALLQSVCRATISARGVALLSLENERVAAGDPRALWERAGRKVDDATARALRVEREARALRLAIASGLECPFWITPEARFDGRQTDRNRWTLNLETGGLLQVRHAAGAFTYGGGGMVRVLGAWGFGGALTVLAGGEFAGGAMLRAGTATSQFVVNYFPAIPIVFRIHDGSWHYDFEVAAVSLFQADDFQTSFGGRIGGGIGISALRTRFVIPWAGIGAAYEHYVESGGRPATEFFRAGLRLGVVFDGR
jgi:hypothetical protein